MPTSDTMVQCHPPLELEELPKEDEERLETLFSKLDADGNGKIDIHDLSVALKELGPHINRSYAEVRIRLSIVLINGVFTADVSHLCGNTCTFFVHVARHI